MDMTGSLTDCMDSYSLTNDIILPLIRSTFSYWGIRNGVMGGLEFVTIDPIVKANTQLTHWYGSGWWNSRGIKRVDVGTSKYPAAVRKRQRI